MTVSELELSPAAQALLASCREFRGLDPRDPLDAVADPQWNRAFRTNDWRKRILSTVADVWEELPLEAQLVAYLPAVIDASLE